MNLVYRQFIKFAIVGVINTGIDFFSYIALTRLSDFWFEHKIGATAVSFLLAVVNSYLMNKYWTFNNHSKNHHNQFSKFFVVSAMGLGMNVLFFNLLLPLEINDIVIKVIVVGIVLFWNFLANKFWTFADK